MYKQLSLFGIQEKETTEKVKNKDFTYVSAFAGIGGMTMGLERVGGKGLMAWEFDPTSKKQYAQEAHKLLHPHIPVDGDICSVDTSLLVDFDVLCFTPPCQTFSIAGKRAGFEDTRGTLTFEALRIARDKKPKALFMENVKGLLNHDKGNTMNVIISAINEIDYVIDFTVLNSKYFDVAQNRERLYLIALRKDLVECENWKDNKGNSALAKAKREYQAQDIKTFNFEWPKEISVNTKISDFLDEIVEDKYYLPKEKETILLEKLKNDGFNDSISIIDTRNKSADIKSGKNGLRISRDICPTINATESKDIKKVIKKVDYITYDPNKIRSNGKPKFLEIYGALNKYGQCSTLKANTGGNQAAKVLIGESYDYRIRKLTPKECLRLQSIEEKYIKKITDNFSDSRCYKFAGNGLTVNLIEAIGKNLKKYL